jgi:hypothetical protein
MSSFYKSALAVSGELHSSVMAEDVKLALELAREVEEELAQEQAKTLEMDAKLAYELALTLDLKNSLVESQRKSAQRRQRSRRNLTQDVLALNRIFWQHQISEHRLLLTWTTCCHSKRQWENGNRYRDIPYNDISPSQVSQKRLIESL